MKLHLNTGEASLEQVPLATFLKPCYILNEN